MIVVVAPDSFTGTLSAPDVAAAIAEGWAAARPDDEVRRVPLSDGGDGLLEVLGAERAHRSSGAARGRIRRTEVVGAHGRPVVASWLLRDDGTAVVESARACGLALLAEDERDPLSTTTWGVGQLLDGARAAGAARILVGLGGSATVDGGAGALAGLGYRLRVADGSGLKVGGGELGQIASASDDWVAEGWEDVEVVLLCDVRTVLEDAPARFGPQKGADDAAVALLEAGLARWAEIVERDLTDRRLRGRPGSGAAGGLSFGLAAGLGGRMVSGSAHVVGAVGLERALRGADLVITGEGRLDATSLQGKVVGEVADLAHRAEVPVAAVVGAVEDGTDLLTAVVESGPESPGGPGGAVREAARRLARGW